MDPVANLWRQRELAGAITTKLNMGAAGYDVNWEEVAGLGAELAEHALALDNWRLTGGFDPYATVRAWAEDPNYPVGDWRLEVANDDTRLGYVEWLEHKRSEDTEQGVA